MMREGDLRMQGDEPRWARHMVPDSVFAFQFNIDFHPTRRVFLNDDRRNPWVNVHTANRNWSTHTDRACFPLRSLIPVEMEPFLGGSTEMQIELDAGTAGIPWELLDTDSSGGDPRPWAIRAKLLR